MQACDERFKRGDVVLCYWPHSDLTGYSKRPALIVQSETLDTGIAQLVLVLITKGPHKELPTRLFVKKDSPAGRAMCIRHDSTVVADSIQTVRCEEIDRTIGYCPDMNLIDQALHILFGFQP